MEDISIGYWIKQRRKTLFLTQKQLADLVGCALITIAKLEADERKPSREVAILLARHLQIHPDQTELFIQITRGEKGPRQLSRLIGNIPAETNYGFNITNDELRNPTLIQRISRSKLIGRRPELAQIIQEWQDARGGESRVVVIIGEPGIGKSKLATEFLMNARNSKTNILIGECFSGGEGPYAPFSRMIQLVPQLPEHLPKSVIADLVSITPQIVSLHPNIQPNPKLEPIAEQMRLFESVFQFFNELAKEAPLIILLEDIHWADHGSVSMVDSLSRRFRRTGIPVLLIITSRHEFQGESSYLQAFFADLLRAHLSTTIHLHRFGKEETRELLSFFFDQDITPEFVELIQQETQGNPFYIEEVCKDLIENGTIYWLNGHWERKEITEIQVPKSVQNTIQARLNKLPKETQDALLMAAILGRRFDFDVLLAALNENEVNLIETLESARKSQIIKDVDNTNKISFEFSHNLISTILREGASSPRRRLLQKQAIQAMEKIYPNEYEILARLCRDTGDTTQAIKYFHKAGNRAMEVYAHEDAIRYYSEALSLPGGDELEACRILLSRGKIYNLRGEPELQSKNLRQAQQITSNILDTGIKAEIELALAEYALMMSEYQNVINHAKSSIDLVVQTKQTNIQAQAAMLWGRTLIELGNFQEARERLTEARNLGRAVGDKLIEARSLINLGNVDYRLGDFNSAEKKYQSALQPVQELGERRIEGMAYNNLGNIASLRGDPEMAIYYYAKTLTIARDIGDRLNEARAYSNIGSVEAEYYQYVEAQSKLDKALEIIRDIGQRGDEVVVLSHMGATMEALGNYQKALEYWEDALTISRDIEDIQSEAYVFIGLCRTYYFMEDYTKAVEHASAAIKIAHEPGLHAEDADANAYLGRAYLKLEGFDDAKKAFSAALALYKEMNLGKQCLEMYSELARLAITRGDLLEAEQLVNQIWPELSDDKIQSTNEPKLCLNGYLVLKEKSPELAGILLDNGYKEIQRILSFIPNASAREHYLKHIPHHKTLAELWLLENNRRSIT